MKYLKISSLLVLSLLLFAPAAFADVECEIRPNSQRIRMESENEMLGALTIRCEWENASEIDADSSFDLEVQFAGDLSNDEDTPATLWLDDDVANREADDTNTATDADGNRSPAPMAEMGRDSVYWEDIKFPEEWTTTSANSSGTFTIADIYIDATSVDDERLEASIEMDGNELDTDRVLTVDSEAVSVARVDQALNLEFAEDNKANDKINACVPGEFDITVTLEEGFRSAWMDGNDILLTVSSGKISADDSGIFDVTGEGDDDELIIDVESGGSTDTANLLITFEPEAGDVGDDLMLSAMLLPVRRSDESFVVSSTLDVGTYIACSGDTLVFPFISNSGGFDTGIAIINSSEVSGECDLMWDGMEAEEGETTDVLRVKAMDTSVFVLSRENENFQGYLKAACNFGGAYGYAYITDYTDARSGAQGYLAVTE